MRRWYRIGDSRVYQSVTFGRARIIIGRVEIAFGRRFFGFERGKHVAECGFRTQIARLRQFGVIAPFQKVNDENPT